MIIDGKLWHYLAVKGFSALLRGITSEHKGVFYCLNCFHLYSTDKKLKKHEKVCNDHDYCYVEMPEEYNKIFKYNHGEKSIKVPFIIYADLESLKNCPFNSTINILDCYRGKDCIESFRKNLKDHATKQSTMKKKEMIPLTDEENKSYEKQKKCYICKKSLVRIKMIKMHLNNVKK